MTKFDGITFNNHWSKWHGSRRVFGVAICRGSFRIDDHFWSVVVFGFELCLWFKTDDND